MPIAVLAVVAGPASSAVARDRDGDGLPDKWERRFGLSTTKKSAKADPDRDRLTNRRERRLRTNPRRRDTDRDRLRDGAEVKRFRTNPRKRDTDGDGLRDRAEIKRHRTNPRKRDTDGDGFSDGREVRAGTNPRDPASHPAGTPGQGAAPPAPAPPPPGTPPGPADVGVPAGWTPAEVRSTSLTVRTPGAVVQDVLFTNGADIHVEAPNVTLRRIKLEGGWIENDAGGCQNGMLLEDVTITRGAAESTDGQEGVVSVGGYTARRVAVLDRSEGFRSGGRSSGCGPATIESSFVRIRPPSACGDWHGDGIQGYDSSGLVVRNVTIDFYETGGCGGTAPFFYVGGNGGSPNGRADIDGLLLRGGSYSFRMGTPGSVRNLKIVNNGWRSGPILITDSGCGVISPWNAEIVEVDANMRVTRTVRSQPCRTG